MHEAGLIAAAIADALAATEPDVAAGSGAAGARRPFAVESGFCGSPRSGHHAAALLRMAAP